jgi:hypothetical protein
MVASAPQISGSSDGRQLFGYFSIRMIGSYRSLVGICQHQIDLGHFKSQIGYLEIKIDIQQLTKLCCQHFFVATRLLGKPIIGNHERPALWGTQMLESDCGHFIKTQFFGCLHTAVLGNQFQFAVDEKWVVETEFFNRSRQLRDLLLTMGSGVVRIIHQR